MGRIVEHLPVKLVTSIIYRDERYLKAVRNRLAERFGSFGSLSMNIPFDQTDYYCEEMGSPLERELLNFEGLVPCGDIAAVKIFTNKVEDDLKENGKRNVNIDPGYLTAAKLVLLTTKDYSHRIYLGSGIYAECTLHYSCNEFRPWQWTYPDYATDKMREYYAKVRDVYLSQMKCIRRPEGTDVH